jgi:hypothetical protein
MVTDEKIINNIVLRYRLGTTLIWSGVLIWLPFIFLKAIGEKPSFLLFLPVHLIGVIGGSRLRVDSRRELGMMSSKKNLIRMAGSGLILLGILVWVPYLYMKIVATQPVEVINYLPYHLAGIFAGLFLHAFSYIRERVAKR